MGVTLDNIPCLDPGVLAASCMNNGFSTDMFQGKANSFSVPAGSSYGRGWVLLMLQQINDLDIESLHTLCFSDDSSATNSTIFFDNLVFIRADCITPGFVDDPNAAYVCELADIRWLLHNPYYSFPLDAQYNLRVPSGGDSVYYPYTCQGRTGNVPHTWQTMLDSIWVAFSSRISSPGTSNLLFKTSPTPQLTFSVNGLPEKFCFYNVSAWLAYSSILRRLASVACPLDMTFTSWQICAIGSIDDPTSNLFDSATDNYFDQRIFDSQPIQSDIARTPSSINVVFHKLAQHHGSEAVASAADSTSFGQWQAAPHFAVGVTTADDLNPETGTCGVLWDDLAAIDNPFAASTIGNQNIINTTSLNSRAAERAADYITAVSQLQAFRVVYSGIINDPGFYPNSFISGYSVYNCGDGYKTEVVCSAAPLSVSASGDWVEEWESINQNLSPPDLSKSTFPDNPTVVQWVAPSSVSTTSPLIYDAQVGLLDPTPSSLGVFRPMDKCWLFNNSGSTTLKLANVFEARYIGQIQANSSTSGTVTRPLYSTDGIAGGSGGGGGGGGHQDTEDFVLSATGCTNGMYSQVSKIITVLTP